MKGKKDNKDEDDKINKKFQTIDFQSNYIPKPKVRQDPNQKGPMFYHYLLNDFNAMKYYQTDVLDKQFTKLESYNDISKIKCAFPSTLKMNDPNFDSRSIKHAKFFILRSTCDDDLHKSIKYGLWTSTYKNNIMLNDLFKKYRRTNTDIYLIYTVVGSGQYSGIARMCSEVELKKTFSYWWEEVKWSGVFNVEWIYIKDVLYDEVEDIRLQNGSKVVSSKDGTELDFETGMKMMDKFKYSIYVSDIFECFQFMDNREEKIRLKRDSMNQIIERLKNKGLIPAVPPKNNRRKVRKPYDKKRGMKYIPKDNMSKESRRMEQNPYMYQQMMMQYGHMPGMFNPQLMNQYMSQGNMMNNMGQMGMFPNPNMQHGNPYQHMNNFKGQGYPSYNKKYQKK